MERILKFDAFVSDSRRYKHEASSIVATEKMMMKTSSETLIEKKYLEKSLDKSGHVFNIKTLSETYGKESATEKISKDMNSIVNNIDVITDAKGKLSKIYNMPDVIKRWDDVKKKWKKEATNKNREQVQKTITTVENNLKNGTFVDDISNQGVLYFLLNGLYGSYDDKEELQLERDLNKFLVTQPLPLKINYKVVDYNRFTKEMVIEGLGEVDEERLDKKTLTKLIRTLKDKINLKVDLQVAYKERFEFDQYHWLVKGEQEVKVKIPGFYMVESKQSIIQTDSDG